MWQTLHRMIHSVVDPWQESLPSISIVNPMCVWVVRCRFGRRRAIGYNLEILTSSINGVARLGELAESSYLGARQSSSTFTTPHRRATHTQHGFFHLIWQCELPWHPRATDVSELLIWFNFEKCMCCCVRHKSTMKLCLWVT